MPADTGRHGLTADPVLAASGRLRISEAERAMPLLAGLRTRFEVAEPFRGMRVACCLNVTPETAVLLRLLASGGAAVSVAASNPLSTQDDIAAALAVPDEPVSVFARAGESRDEYRMDIAAALGFDGADGNPPELVVDDGGDLVHLLHQITSPERLNQVRGGCESTATGVLRLRQMAAAGVLGFPVIAADDTPAKRLLDNVHGTGQSVLDGIIRATGMLLAGKTVVVAGFGPCGSGIAARAAGLGARIVVTEVDPVRALDAALRGYQVLPMAEAAPLGDVFITATGSVDVLTGAHFAVMRDGAVLANAGHFDAEISVPGLSRAAAAVQHGVHPHTDGYRMPDQRRLLLIAEGRVVNLIAAAGHPPEVMDLSFGIVALVLERLAQAGTPAREPLPPAVHPVPGDLDAEAARLVLGAWGFGIDALTASQRGYLESWHRS